MSFAGQSSFSFNVADRPSARTSQAARYRKAEGALGKAVQIGRGRAAVTGERNRILPLLSCVTAMGRRGRAMRLFTNSLESRKPEDLPETNLQTAFANKRADGIGTKQTRTPTIPFAIVGVFA